MMPALSLPRRKGSRPRTRDGIPHQQLDQNPEPRVYQATLARFLETPHTHHGPSLISVPGSQALFLDEGCSCNPDAFMRGREFAHLHPAEDGSFHMILDAGDCAHVLEQGWGELHPLARDGRIQATTTMIFAPRDEEEIDIVLGIAAAALRHATSPQPAAPRDGSP